MQTTLQRHDHALQNLNVYIRKVGREQVLGPCAERTIRFREDHDSILCDSLLRAAGRLVE
jgi:hypothetical protein